MGVVLFVVSSLLRHRTSLSVGLFHQPKPSFHRKVWRYDFKRRVGMTRMQTLKESAPNVECNVEKQSFSSPNCYTNHMSGTQIRVGHNRNITRWTHYSKIRYIICAETFLDPHLATYAAGKFAEAAQMWENSAVRFKLVHRNERATFRVVYSNALYGPDVLAMAFFPNENHADERTLVIYSPALAGDNREHLSGVLAHELGHIQGLRHEFETRRDGSVRWGKRNPRSIMNWFEKAWKCRVRTQDIAELKCFYKFTARKYMGFKIEVLDPPMTRYGVVES